MGGMTIRDLLQFDWLQLQVSTVAAILVGSFLFVMVSVVLWRNNNRLAALDNRCSTALADVDTQLKYRQNLIPGLVETVRAYVDQESEILLAVVNANAEVARAATQNARLEAEVQLGNTVNSLLNTVAKYPELTTSSHFRELRQQLVDVENKVTAARRFANLAAEEYNTKLSSFPANIIAKMQKRSTRAQFNLGDERTELDQPFAFKF
jgi:LemA protein